MEQSKTESGEHPIGYNRQTRTAWLQRADQKHNHGNEQFTKDIRFWDGAADTDFCEIVPLLKAATLVSTDMGEAPQRTLRVSFTRPP